MRILNELLDITFNLLARYWWVVLPVCILAFILAVWFLVRLMRGKSEPQGQGASAGQARLNRTVPMSLRRLPPDHYKIHSDVFVPRLDGDGNTRLHHVVVSRFGVFIILVQHERGLVTGSEEDREWNLIQEDGRKRFVNPIIRSTYHVKALAKYLNFPESSLFPLIYFDSEPRIEAFRPPHLLTEGLGRHIISRNEEILTQEDVDDVALKFACLTSHRNPEVAMQKHQAARVRRLRQTKERAA